VPRRRSRLSPPAPSVEIRKEARLLRLHSKGKRIKEYSVGLGGSPLPDKEREGDSRTPVGEFTICTRLEQSRFHRFLGISYPGPEDAERGLKQGMINRKQYQVILDAHRRKRQPPWNTPLGGEVGIHGGGSGADWTLGCIALENEAAAELFRVLPLGTRVLVV
jgi:murein L,D-transpeptidase YafK